MLKKLNASIYRSIDYPFLPNIEEMPEKIKNVQ